MNEPLNYPLPAAPFSGKSLNKHPQWYNQPLRLNEEKLHRPLLVAEDFFQCYHLQEAREILWSWLVAVISSPLSISNDPHERNNHLYFYEKVEELIEAAFVARNKAKKKDQRKRRRPQGREAS